MAGEVRKVIQRVQSRPRGPFCQGSYLGQWIGGLEAKAARNVVIVATANKLARISWAVLSSGENYHPMPVLAVAS